jgi:hypothetical protein
VRHVSPFGELLKKGMSRRIVRQIQSHAAHHHHHHTSAHCCACFNDINHYLDSLMRHGPSPRPKGSQARHDWEIHTAKCSCSPPNSRSIAISNHPEPKKQGTHKGKTFASSSQRWNHPGTKITTNVFCSGDTGPKFYLRLEGDRGLRFALPVKGTQG